MNEKKLKALLKKHGKLKLAVFHDGELNRYRELTTDTCTYWLKGKTRLKDAMSSCFVNWHMSNSDLVSEMYRYDLGRELEIEKVYAKGRLIWQRKLKRGKRD